jgi:hypothetical protein
LFACFAQKLQWCDSIAKEKEFRFESVYAGAQMFLSISLLGFVISQSAASYETHLPSNKLVKDSVSGLYYSPKKLANIQGFRSQADRSGSYTGQKILDLSFWHPGVILYLGGLQFPSVIDNKVFRDTLDLQLSKTVGQLGSSSSKVSPPMIVETSLTLPLRKCLKLSEYIEDRELRNLIIRNDFNPNVLNSAIYLSDEVDLTLHPKNIAYLVPCKL